jgi:hypothetical protein
MAGRFVRHRYLARRQPSSSHNLRQVHLIPAELFETLRSEGYGSLAQTAETTSVH